MAKNARSGGPDLLALAMRRARDDVAAGRAPKCPPEPIEDATMDAALETSGDASAEGDYLAGSETGD